MSARSPSIADEPLLRDLVDGLSATGPDASVSLGIVGGTQSPQPPAHCLQTCLGGDPAAIEQRGCPLLRDAARQQVHPDLLPRGVNPAAQMHGGRCRQGFRVAARQTTLGGETALLLSVAGRVAWASGPRAGCLGAGHDTDPLPAGRGSDTELFRRLDAAGQLVQRIADVLEENAGFANEVLQNYEQLNLIFDLTHQIAQITDARQIEALLVQRVANLLAARRVSVVTSEGDVRAYACDENGAALEPTLLAHPVQLVQRLRQVQVVTLDGRPVIVGPLVRLDEKVDVVLADRDAGQATFSAGDVLLVESMLAFGGQIVSNTELHERLRRMSLEVTHAMVAAIDKKDHYTSGHSERGGFLTRLTARELGLSPAEQQTMEWAGLLHDIGKIGIPEEILCKPGKLTTEEFEVIKQHPRMGYEILKPIASLGLILDGVLYHHEYPDGSGYPEGLRGQQIPLVARIIHVVDTFDALTSTRAYRKAFSVQKTLEIIREEMGTRIDAQAAGAFFRAFANYRREQPEDYAARFPNVVEREIEHAQP